MAPTNSDLETLHFGEGLSDGGLEQPLASFTIGGQQITVHHDEEGLQICNPDKCLILREATASEAMGLIELFKTMEERNGRPDS